MSSNQSSDQVVLSHGVLQKWLQFRSGSSTKLWATFLTAIVIISAIRIPWLFPGGIEQGQDPSEYYHYRVPQNKALLWVHLASVIPAGLLATTQFVPRIRARAIGFHRNVGKLVNLLSVVATITGWGMGRIAFGGDLATQSSVYVLGFLVLYCVVKSWRAARRLQMDEHRIWAIRAWSYHAQVLSERVIMGLAFMYMSRAGGYYYALPCNEIAYILNDRELYTYNYPQCNAGWPGSQVTHVAVEANINDPTGLGLAAAARACFGACMWAALLVHVIGTEYYLYKTRHVSENLLETSFKRQKVRQAIRGKRADGL